MSFVMDVPERLLGDYYSGDVQIYGAILKNTKTGKIIGHLRESKSLIDLLSKIPANPVTMVTGIINSASGIVANYQLAQQGVKIDRLIDQVEEMSGLLKTTASIATIGAVASIATFALCAAKFKAIEDRLGIIEKKSSEIIDKLEEISKDNERRELRGYLSEIKGCFDYLLPDASQTRIENIQGGLSKCFFGVSGYLQDKIGKAPDRIDIDDVVFLYNVMLVAAMGEFRGFILMDDVRGAKHILQSRKTTLSEVKRSFSYISTSVIKNKDMRNYQVLDKAAQFERLVDNVVSCYNDFSSQEIIVSEYIGKNKISLKSYYEEIERDIENSGLVFVAHN